MVCVSLFDRRVALLLVMFGAPARSAQTATSISGVVRDAAGGVVPGVTVVVKDDNTGTRLRAVTSADGTYQCPGAAGRAPTR